VKQHRVTSETFYSPTQGDVPVPDAYIDPLDLTELKKLAGLDTLGLLQPVTSSTVQENLSHTGTEKAELMRKHNIKPGTDEWFALWFSLPKLTGRTGDPEQEP
jgi:hypothetical protein